MTRHEVGFRLMRRDDLATVALWLATPVAAPWFPAGDRDALLARFHDRLRGHEPTRMLIAQVREGSAWTDVGMLQAYRVQDSSWVLAGLADGRSVAIDYVIGQPSRMGQGLGAAVVRAFLGDVRPPLFPGAPEVLAAPDHRNVASRRLLVGCGFREDLWVDEPSTPGQAVRTVVVHRLRVADGD